MGMGERKGKNRRICALFFPTNRYESYRCKLAVRSDMMAIYWAILREDSSSRREYRYGIHPHPLCHILIPSLFFPSCSPSQFAVLPFTTSELAGRSGGGQRSRRGFSGICRLKPPTGLVTTQFQSLGR